MSSLSTIATAERAFAHTAESVYDAWLDPAIARDFLFRAAGGQVVRCEIEPSLHGRFTLVDKRPVEGESVASFEVEHAGRFLQLDRPRRIAFSFWLPQLMPRETTVVIDIAPQGDGSRLALRHDLGLGEQAVDGRERAAAAWAGMLERLDQALAGR